MRPYKITYLVPVYYYTIQLYWIFDPQLTLDDSLLHVYAGGVCVFVALASVIINNFFNRSIQNRATKINVLEEMLDLSMNIKNKRADE